MSIYYSSADGVKNIKNFGAVGDGVTDNTTAIDNAVASLKDGETLFIPEGRFLTTGSVITKPVCINGPGTLVVDIDDYAFHVNLDLEDVHTISGLVDYDLGTPTLAPHATQITSVAHGLSQGDVIKIAADLQYGKIAGDYIGELSRVIKVIDADNFVASYIEDIPVSFSGNMHFRKVPTGHINIDVNIDFVPDNDVARSNQEPLVEVQNAIDPRVNVSVTKSYARIFQGNSIFKGKISIFTQDVDDTDDTSGNPLNEFGYGIVIGGGSCGTLVQVSMGGGRHAFTTRDFATGSAYSNDAVRMREVGACKDIIVHDSISINSYLSAFDTHILAKRTKFVDCHAIHPATLDDSAGGFPLSFADRSQNTEFHNCTSKGARVAWQLDGADYWDTHVILNGCSDVDTTTRTISFVNTSGNSTVEVSSHKSRSSCMWLEITQGRAILNDIHWRTVTGFSQPNILIGNSGSVFASNIHHIAGTSSLAPFEANTSATASLRLRNYHVERLAGTPHGLLNARTGSTFTVDLDDASFSSFPAEGLIRTSSQGTINLVSDSWRSLGRRIEYRSTQPNTGNHFVGDITYKTNPGPSGSMGWICTASGNPGTWKTFGEIALQREINVKDFGAVGNGVTEDTTAIQSAINAAGTNGRIIFPKSTYLVSGVTTSASGQVFELEGATIVRKDSTNGNLLTLQHNNCKVIGGIFDGNSTNQSPANEAARFGYSSITIDSADYCEVYSTLIKNCVGLGIRGSRCQYANIHDNTILGVEQFGIYIEDTVDDAYGNRVINNYIDNSNYEDGGGIYLTGNNDLTTSIQYDWDVSNNITLGHTFAATSTGITTRGTNGRCTNNQVTGYGLGISCDATSNSVINSNRCVGQNTTFKRCIEVLGAHNIISSNFMQPAADGFGISISDRDPGYNAITGNTILHAASGNLIGIEINVPSGESAPYCSIAGNTIKTNFRGIQITRDTPALNITANTIHGPGSGVSNSAGIYFNEKSGSAVITGNTISAFERFVIFHSSASLAYSNITITSNDFSGEGPSPTLHVVTTGSASYGNRIMIAWNGTNSDNLTHHINRASNIQLLYWNSFVSPESNVTAGIGSIYISRLGGSGTTFFVKETGTGNTGWFAK